MSCLSLRNGGWHPWGCRLKGALFKYLRGFALGLLLFGSVVLGLWSLGALQLEAPLRLVSLVGAFVLLPGWIIQGAAEELLTRGLLLQIFGRMTHSLFAIAISAIFFAYMHIGNNGVHLLAYINLLLFGIFAGIFTLHERGLWGIYAIHSVWNWAQGNLFGLQVSGHEIKTAIVVDLKTVGPAWLTGGDFGPEGGLMVTVVLLIATFWVGIAYQKSSGQSLLRG